MRTPTGPSQAAPTAQPFDDVAPWVIVLSCWLVAGLAAVLCVPALRGSDPLFGWLPFWFVVVPAIDLAFLRRRSLFAALRPVLAGIARRRRGVRQARPMRRRSRTARHAQPLARNLRQRIAAAAHGVGNPFVSMR